MINSVIGTVGDTPMLALEGIRERLGLRAKIIAKAEHLNPGGSIKDRVAVAMIKEAEKDGRLARGGTIIEPTSGNTGIALAMLGSALGYRVKIVMPSSASVERRELIRAYGGEVVLTSNEDGMSGAIRQAEALLCEQTGGVILGQFTSPAAVACHYYGTAAELWRGTGGKIDAFVAGVGTGATLTGIGRFFKDRSEGIRTVAVEPSESAALTGGRIGTHGIEGIGAGFIPPLYDGGVVDGVECVSTDEAIEAVRLLAECEGILAGVSTGAALCAAVRVARRDYASGGVVALLIADRGERYFSRGIFCT